MLTTHAVPIMKEHTLSVMTLEEYEPNKEFVGRNFNAGEIIQLVLKARSGHWLPFNYVQMVMMHELAHCKQMNHSKAFWAVRNNYAEQMKILWTRGYTGEGLWGRGALLSTGEFERNTMGADEALPEHLCGGMYRSRRRKRKAKQELSYQERKERRILKKFGANGVALGDDDSIKAKLEKGRRTQAKPRVAGSNRGRELRAAAALARFDQSTKEKEEETKVGAEDEESETESEYEEDEGDNAGSDAVDINGKKLLDQKGQRMVKVCEDGNPVGDQDAANELLELQSSLRNTEPPPKKPEQTRDTKQYKQANSDHKSNEKWTIGMKKAEAEPSRSIAATRLPTPQTQTQTPTLTKTCPICSFQNEGLSVTCSMCSNVLDRSSVPGTWSCQSASCQDSPYLNAGDCGTCGVCGQRKG